MSWYKNRVEAPGEVIREIVVADDGAGFGVADADIAESRPHYHTKTEELYVLLSGKLEVFLGTATREVLEQPLQTLRIPLHTLHWARSIGNVPARVLVVTLPVWVMTDHHLVESVDL